MNAPATENAGQMASAAESPGWALRLSNVNKSFEGVQALKDVAFRVRLGEIHCLAGENGCGKSTLIKIVTGVYSPDPGTEIEVFGKRLASVTPASARALGISVIWQDLALFPHMTVAENIAFDESVGMLPRLYTHGASYKRADKILRRLRVDLNLNATLNSLPIAQRQIVAIARALHGHARLIFMDEPTSSLTQSETNNLLKIVKTLSEEGVSVVFVSHRLAEVIEISSRLTVLRNGRLVGVYDTADMTQTRLGHLMTGQDLVSEISARDRTDRRAVLEVEGLNRKGEFRDISLDVKSGEIVGVIGLIGAGRTELAHSLIGMTKPDSGTIRLDGRKIAPRSVRDAIAAGIAYVSEDRLTLGLIQQQSIAANIVITVLKKVLGKLGLISPKRE
ncbi:MAG: sugar ABC transporter ATP-binding protein, partial [Albidovulum sp.]|nr:sugar ABC transporter ATP-binding protein [Albidovulum sp.]